MTDETKESTGTESGVTESRSTQPAAATQTDPPPATSAPAAIGSTAAGTQTTAAETTPATVAGQTAAGASETSTSDPTPQPEPAAASLRSARFDFLRAMVAHAVAAHAVAASAPAANRVAAQSEHREIAKRELAALGAGADWVSLMLQLLDKLRNVPLPTQEQIDGWVNLAQEVFSVWRQFFAHSKPVDQELNDALHNLSNSIDGNKILGTLAQRAEATGKAGSLDPITFENILDGHQDKELAKIGVAPRSILPLVNAINHAKAMLAAKAEHEKVSAANS